jgi:signal transduction histidine kinase
LAAAIAHEVRNPLASLSGAVQLLRREQEDEPLHEIIHREVGRINSLVTDFLENTRLGVFNLQPADLATLVSEVVEAFSKDARYREIIRLVEEVDDLPLLDVDAERIRQVMWNLLLNAAQAMPSGGMIHISAVQVGDRIRLMVADEGVGIPEADLQRIFDPFYTTRQGGTGLGLATVERVAREHGGSVWVRSEPGGGTAIAIWLPLPAELPTEEMVYEEIDG